MEKTKFTFYQNQLRHLFSCLMVLTLVAFTGNSLDAQSSCSLACNTNTQVSLDMDCEAEITPDMLLNANQTSCPDGQFTVNVSLEIGGDPIPGSPVVDGEYIGMTLVAEIYDNVSTNSCWGYIHIEDKMPPQIVCENDTIDCVEMSTYMPEIIENCGGFDPILLNETEEAIDCNSEEADDYVKRITRTYYAVDDQGNESEECTVEILLRRFDHESIVCPDSLRVQDGNALSCDEGFPVDDEGNPHPSYTGVPTSNGIDLYPDFNFYCNVSTTYDDVVFPQVNCVTKVMRIWTIQEWTCGGDVTSTCIQIIEIVDEDAPALVCPNDITVTTSPHDCDAFVQLPVPAAPDNCSDDVEIDVVYPGGFIDDFTGGGVTLPAGLHEVTYTAYDECLNSASCTITVLVEDETPPIAVCDQNTVVSLTSDGTAWVYAGTFDDGSWDECALDYMEVRRMDNPDCAGSDGTPFAESVPFYCCDVGSVVQVEFRVFDEAGNANSCMVNVTVQDKLPPIITCPADMTVECNTPFDIDDPASLDAQFGAPSATDNCDVEMVSSIDIGGLNQCGEGTVFRIFTATDPGGLTDQCIQRIDFIDSDPFDGDNDIDWPADVDLDGCLDPAGLDPSVTGEPSADQDACALVGFTYDDDVFTIVQGDGCFKIIRHWKAIDWCQFEDNEYEEWTYDQVIKVRNTDDPVITTDLSPVSTCTFDDECLDGFIELGARAEDPCTPADQLEWTYQIDVNNDGSFDFAPVEFTGDSIDASGNYPIGTHRIVFTVEDLCGNLVAAEQVFTIVNCKAPTPYCINGLAVDLMPIDTDNDGVADWGMVELWASDFDAGSNHPCTDEVFISFSEDINNTNMVFDCNDAAENDGIVDVEIWASIIGENGQLIQAWCNTYVHVQDNMEVCPEIQSTARISGNVATEEDEDVSDVVVALEGSELSPITTEDDGMYEFQSMPTGGEYSVEPAKNTDPMNGISTLDLVMIQKHILDIEMLDSPYKIIAADINKDNNVSASDLVELRKLILGLQENFNNNESWRFVDRAYEFVNAENPLNETFPEVYAIPSLDDDMAIEFVGVKTGDVNNSAVASNLLGSIVRNTDGALEFITDEQSFEAGQEVVVELKANNFNNILGYQHTISFDQALLSFDRIESGKLDVNEAANFGLHRLDEGVITTSWNKVSPMTIADDQALYTLVFTAKGSGKLSTSVAFNSRYTQAEAYNNANDELDVNILFRNENGSIANADFELYQNTPNPFDNTTVIGFNMPEAGNASLTVFDVTGRVLSRVVGDYSKGYNAITISKESISATGILYYQLETATDKAVKKMVVIR